MYNKEVKKFTNDVEQHDNINITISLKTNQGLFAQTGTHAPHAEDEDEVKDEYYDMLQHTSDKYGKGCNITLHYIGGDLNARSITATEEESSIMGKAIFNQDQGNIHSLSEKQIDHRSIPVDVCCSNSYIFANTWYEKKG